MIKLYLTRHGETIGNVNHILQGQTPGALNEYGIKQAENLRKELASVSFDIILSSDLARAVHTATILAAPHNMPVITTPLLRERDWGEFTGKSIGSLTVSPKDFPPSVESPIQLEVRAKQFLQWLLAKYDNLTILAVAHGYFNRCIEGFIRKIPVHKTARWGNTEVRIFDIDSHTMISDSISISTNNIISDN